MHSLGIEAPRKSKSWWLILFVVWIVSGLYTASLLKRGWVPHDEGTIGQSAERVLEGQLPHRDFDEVYTGGLTYLNALAFRWFGENLASPRVMLFLFFLAWVPAVFWVASRFAGTLGAAAVTLLAVAWSIPNYSAALPSWYNLFFATFGLAAVLRFLDTNHRKWLFVAGLCCGISFLFKLSAIYFAAGVFLFFVFHEQENTRSDRRGQRTRAGVYSAFVVMGLIGFLAALVLIVRNQHSAVAYEEFVVPGLSIAALCLGREFAGIPGASGRRFSSLVRMVLPFILGALLPVLLFLISYLRAGAVGDWFNGVFILPGRRLAFASNAPRGFGPNKILGTVGLTGLLIAAYCGKLRSRMVQAAIVIALVAVFVLSVHAKVYQFAWAPLLLLIPLSSLAGVFVLGNSPIPSDRKQQVMLLLSITATCTLIQLPFSAPIYFCYVAPLLALSLLALFSISERPTRAILGILLAFYLAFAVFRVTPGFIHAMGYHFQPDPETETLNLPRAGGLRITPAQAIQYEELIPEIEAHVGNGAYIYAAPDCPEVYFLSGKANPTPTMFDFFDARGGESTAVLQAIDSRQVRVVTINFAPKFSGPLPNDLLEALRREFPDSKRVGDFEVRWRP